MVSLRPGALALMLAVLAAAVADAQPHFVWDVEGGWHARWIEAADLAPADSQNVWTAHRAKVRLGAAPTEAVARVAVDSKYWLWVNGRLVVREGGLKRGPMPGATYADRVDLSAHLRAGENTLAVLAWYFGKDGLSHADSGQPGLLFDLEADRRPVALRWRARRHPAYGNTGPPHPNWRLPESNVLYDARREMAGWTGPHFDDAEWPDAVALGPAGGAPWGPLVLRPVPQWRDYGLRAYADAPAFPFVSDGDPIVVSLPYNSHVTPALDVEAPAGALIDVRTDNYQGGGEFNIRAEVVTRAGRQVVEVPGWMNGHTIRYAVPAGVTVHGLGFRETSYDADLAGAFTSSDGDLNTLWNKARRTLLLTMRDTYMDCPDRERAQWWGDVVLETGEGFYALSRSADALARKGILELAAWQRSDSTLYSPVPSGPLWDKELPTQMLASVGHYGIWTYYLHTGDDETVRRVYPAVRDYLAVWETDARGLVVERPGGWTWGDWGEHKDLPLIYNGWYALALRGQRALASVAGHDGDTPAIDARLAALEAAFDLVFWTPDGYRSPDHAGPTDERGNALAVLAGLAPEARFPTIRRILREQRHASPYFEKYVGEALIRMGHADDALTRIRERYRPMIESPLTTLWEGWGIGAEGFGGGTSNHAWSGGPLTLLSRYVVGIEPVEPGYGVLRIAPRLGSLARASAVVQSARGAIAAEARQSISAFELDVSVPDGTEAIVEVPVEGRRVVRAGGLTIWRADGAAVPGVEGVTIGRVSRRAADLGPAGGPVIVLRVPAGEWRFRAE